MQDYKGAVMRVIEPENKRAEFEMAYKRYATSLEALMPNHVTKDDINDLKWMAYVRASARARYEPEKQIDIADCGEKARAIISEHLKAQGVIQWIRPISLFDKDFQEKMDTLKSDEAVASSMEHAIRHTISVKMEDNPVHYTSLLEKLQQILDETKLRWEERRAKLKEFIDREIDHSEEDGAEYLSSSDVQLYKDMTFEVVKTIKDNRLDGFASNKAKADQVEKAIQGALMTNKYYGFGYQKLKQLVNPLLELAKRHYATDND